VRAARGKGAEATRGAVRGRLLDKKRGGYMDERPAKSSAAMTQRRSAAAGDGRRAPAGRRQPVVIPGPGKRGSRTPRD
jgi:hypothetical protein